MRLLLLSIIILISSSFHVLYGQWLQGATKGLIYYNDGNVGINTNSPNASLEVVNRGVETLRLRAPNLGSNMSHIHHGINGDWYIRSASTAGKIILQDAGGNVGIGTGTPTSGVKLDIVSTSWNLKLENSNVGGGKWFFGSTSNGWNIGGGKFVISSSEASTDSKLVISSQGSVGIGTTSPSQDHKLDVNGNGVFRGDLSVNRKNTIHANRGKLNFSHVLTDFNHSIYNNFDNIDGEGAWDGMKFNVFKGASFRTGDHANATTALYINEDGKIGIGTQTPGENHLAVNGTIKAKEVKVTLSDWPDYVFENSYALPSLEEVENHIKEKGHLKDIPSATDVEENGVNLGEMDKKLLQKIEELTLYMIEQSKQIEDLKKENQEMRNEMKVLLNK